MPVMQVSNWDDYGNGFGTTLAYLQNGYLNADSPVASNIKALDDILSGGFRAGLHVIGGEPASGKSSFGLFLGMMCALSGAHVLYASLEMSRSQCMERCLSYCSLDTGKPFGWGDVWKLAIEARTRQQEASRIGSAAGFIKEFMSDDPVALASKEFDRKYPGLIIADSNEVHELNGLVETVKRGEEAGLDLLIVDYLQFVDVEGVSDEYSRVSHVSKMLNRLGVNLNIPVIALASCSRTGSGSAPTMHGFKGTGNIEYDALTASIMQRDPDDPNGKRRLHVVKNRFGRMTAADKPLVFRFDGAHNSFEYREVDNYESK